jgi:hypothetical protein
MASVDQRGSPIRTAGRKAAHQYRLMYYANEQGEAKRTEFAAPSLDRAIEIGLSDHSSRTIDIWEDGEFACRLSRDASETDAKHRKPASAGNIDAILPTP